MQYQVLSPDRFSEYELIDAGDGQKLERFGKYILIRPEPAAIWPPQLPISEWMQTAHARFKAIDAMKGKWEFLRNDMVSTWSMNYRASNFSLKMECRVTQFKHLGIFPEQASHWEYIFQQCKQIRQPKVLNLFAYTGGASLAARAAGADVIHLESMKQVVSWARHNMELNGLADIRWLIEDALKFVQREEKRGNKYNGIVMDPPAFGIGPKGERWKLQDKLNELMSSAAALLEDRKAFFLLNTYSHHISPLSLKTLVDSHFGTVQNPEIGELALKGGKGQLIPSGSFVRFRR